MSIINRQISIKFQNIWRNSICYIIALCCQKVKVQNWSWLSWLWFSLLSCSPWSSEQTGKTGQPGQARQERQIWHLNLTFCVRQLSQFLWCFIHGRVWITRSTLEERERLSNGSFVGTIEVKGDLDKKEARMLYSHPTPVQLPHISALMLVVTHPQLRHTAVPIW